jgi:hypothetical protein
MISNALSYSFVAVIAVLGLQAQANTQPVQIEEAGYYQIASIETEEIQELMSGGVGAPPIGLVDCNSKNLANGAKPTPNPLNPIDEIEIIVDKVINIGKKIWAVVEAGRPVVDFKTDVATALPAGARCWNDLQQWQAPRSKTYSVSMKNLYNSEVVRFVYRVNYLVGGTADGIGKYIGYATAIPKDLYVAWGYKFDAKATVPVVYNMGTRSEPMAGMQITMQYKVSTVMNVLEQSQVYTIDGLGNFAQLE